MILCTSAELQRIAPFFRESDETMIRSCLQGIMGSAWADDPKNPRCARIDLGDFSFLGGDGSTPGALSLAAGARALAVPLNQSWERAILAAFPEAVCFDRYAFFKDPMADFDKARLRKFADRLPEGYTLSPLDEKSYGLCQRTPWAQDFCAQFPTWADFAKKGLGWLIWRGEALAAGASSYSVYGEGIEIQIETQKDHRRRGLALCCGARLMLDCLDRGLYPSWDAANPASVGLAQKLGYRLKGSYKTWMIRPVLQE